MRNDILLKTTWVVEDGINEIYYDFYNTDGKYVGNIIVTEQGKISWSLLDLNYEGNVGNVINYIIGKNDNRITSYEMNDNDPKRWDRAKIYIATHNLVLNKSIKGVDEEVIKNNVR